MGDPNPAVLDPKFRHALGYAVDTEQIVRTAYQGAAEPGTTIVPPAYSTWHWEPPDDVKFTFDLDKAAGELDAAGYVKGSDGKRTMPDGSPIGTLRLFARSESQAVGGHAGPVPELARPARHRRRGHRDGQLVAGRRDPRGQLRHLPVGLVRRARPGRDPRGLHLRPARQALGLLVLRRGLRRDVRRPGRRDRQGRSASRSSSRCSSSSTRTRPTS